MTDPPPRTRIKNALLLAGGAVGASAVVLAVFASRTEPALLFLGRFHPLAVHLPIGMIMLVGALEALTFAPAFRTRLDPALSIVLWLALASAVAAFALGSMLGSGGEYPERLLHLHRRLTFAMIVAAAASGVAWTLHLEGRAPRSVYRASVLVTMALLGAGAHFGGSLTHGADFLVEYAPAFLRTSEAAGEPPPPPVHTDGDRRLFADAVLPILNDKCASCHGSRSAKGRLRLDGLDALMKGGRSGPSVVPGDARESLLIRRIDKPLSDDAHMPPEGEPQLDAAEREIIALWIDRGASADLRIGDVLVSADARRLLLRASDEAKARHPVDPGTPKSEASTTSADAMLAAGAVEKNASDLPAASAPEASVPATPEASSPMAAGAAPTPHGHVTSEPPRQSGRPRDDEAIFRDRIAPILAAKCGWCHGEKKQRGGLRTDSLAALVAGGASGPAIVPGSPGRGTLLARIQLPLEHEDHMPPQGTEQLDARELEILSRWLSRGATARSAHARPSSIEPRAEAALGGTSTPAAPDSAPGAAPGAAQDSAERSARHRRAGGHEPTDPTPAPSASAIAAPVEPARVRGGCAGCAAASEREDERSTIGLVGTLLALAVASRRLSAPSAQNKVRNRPPRRSSNR